MSYLVYVEGKSSPVKEHMYLVDAKAEAERLATHPDNKMRNIYVVKIVTVSQPVVSRQWLEPRPSDI